MRRRAFLASVSSLALLPLIPKTPMLSTVETHGTEVIDGVLQMSDVVFTASGESVGPFRYFTLLGRPLVSGMVFDYGSDLTLLDGESFTLEIE